MIVKLLKDYTPTYLVYTVALIALGVLVSAACTLYSMRAVKIQQVIYYTTWQRLKS